MVKGDPLTLTCEVYPDLDYEDDIEDNETGVLEEDLGRPLAQEYIWTRGGHVVNDVRSRNWTIESVTVEVEANISCYAVNAVGRGKQDFIQIDVLGRNLGVYHGVLGFVYTT